MRKIILMLVILTMIFGSIVYVYAGETKDFNNQLTREELQEKINLLNEKFPEARLKMEDFLQTENLLSAMSEIERFEYVCHIIQSEPERVFYHEDESGVESTLTILSTGGYVYANRILGEVDYEGSYATYTNTLVYLDFTYGLSNHDFSYKVNHERNLQNYSGTVTWSGSVTTRNRSNLELLNGHMLLSTGEVVFASAQYYLHAVGEGGITNPNVYPSVYLYFNASTLDASGYR